MHRARCLIVLSAFLFVPAQATAQDEWEQQVLEQIRTVADVFSSDGFALDAETPRGTLKSEALESFALTLESGFEYLLVGACDVDCTDIDLIIFDEAGNDVGSDYEEDDAPVLTVEPSRTQSYRVHVYMATCTNEPCRYAVGVLARRATATATSVSNSSDGSRLESGHLSSDDRRLDSGEYYDTYSLSGTAGDYVVIDLRSTDFDPYLMLVSPSREHFENDDYEGDARRSQVAMELPESGDYIVGVTSYKADETGAYEVRIDRSAASSAASGPRVEYGDLAAGDETLESGEYADAYRFEGVPGQRVNLDASSSDFDTYLMLIDPNGESTENDDADGLPGHSVVEADITEVGTHLVVVTSYKPNETGSYELSMNFGAASSTSSRQRDVVELAVGGRASGRLEPGDRQMDTGEYGDLYVFDGSIGESVNIEMTSSDFDTYLALVTPGGDQIENDDYESSSSRSRIDVALRETGRYRIITTSYKGNETGDYQLALSAGASIPTTAAAATGSGGRVYGVFAGISDYPGGADDLPYTAEDAHRVHDALVRAGMRSEDAIILTDEDATYGAVQSAFNTLSDRIGPHDTFVFFYSGHGNRIPRSEFQPSDPDAMDETIELYDGSVTDDQMSQMLAGLNAGTSIVVLDACFSGGFAKDVISVPGRMGLFSSEEDVTSSVAAKFRAGGYLAAFLADAVGDGLADGDDDGGVSALELSQYLHERYRADVKSTGSSDYVRTGGPQLGYQHLVVDRGSISPYEVLFYFERGSR